MQLEKTPVTVVTGFLGSGKTTLLSNVIRQAAGKRIAVIVNEFGELDIDADLLRNCPLDCDEPAAKNTDGKAAVAEESGIYELANGCICCTVEEEFLPVMKQLIERRDDIDHILIETSGLALPKPLVQAFNWPGIKEYCTVDAVITLVDGPAVAKGQFADDVDKVEAQRLADEGLNHDPSLQELLDDQLSAADLIIVSKNDLLTDEQRSAVAASIAKKLPSAVKTLYLDQGQVSLDVLIGINAEAEKQIEGVHNHHDHHHAHGSHHDHAHDHFDSHVISLGVMDEKKLHQTLKQLFKDFTIFRAKGFVALPEKPMRQVVQGVGERLDSHFDRLWQADEARLTQLVFIGKQLDLPKMTAALKLAEINSAV